MSTTEEATESCLLTPSDARKGQTAATEKMPSSGVMVGVFWPPETVLGSNKEAWLLRNGAAILHLNSESDGGLSKPEIVWWEDKVSSALKAGLKLIVLDHVHSYFPEPPYKQFLKEMAYEQRGLIHIVDWNALKAEILKRKPP